MELTAHTLDRIEKTIAKYPVLRSAMLPVLHIIQEEKGYLDHETQEWVAKRLEVTPIQVREVVTFYPMYREKPIGKVHVKVCRTLSCALMGAYKVCEKLEQELHCKRGETSKDGKYTIEFVECIADCGMAPVVQVDDKLYEFVKPDSVDSLIADIKKLSEAGPEDHEAIAQPGEPGFKG